MARALLLLRVANEQILQNFHYPFLLSVTLQCVGRQFMRFHPCRLETNKHHMAPEPGATGCFSIARSPPTLPLAFSLVAVTQFAITEDIMICLSVQLYCKWVHSVSRNGTLIKSCWSWSYRCRTEPLTKSWWKHLLVTVDTLAISSAELIQNLRHSVKTIETRWLEISLKRFQSLTTVTRSHLCEGWG